MRKPVIVVTLGVVVVGLVVGLALFEPWRAFTSSTLDEPVPVAATGTTGTTATPATPAPAEVPAEPAGPFVLAEGAFVGQEHPTSGTARVLELPDGSRVLRVEDFSTSDGPDVHVWLSDAAAAADWHAYDDGRHVPLGELKATDGNHNYAIPPDADLTGLRSAVIWCDRFDVAFGSAALAL
jgi:electron transfer DM13